MFVSFSETARCSDHWECGPGLRCVNTWCGDPAYHAHYNMRPCQEDADCEDRRTGEMCCLDLARPLEWRWGKRSLVKKCCNNPNNVPVLAPQHNLSSQERRELDKGESCCDTTKI